jgi:hypothetical protein
MSDNAFDDVRAAVEQAKFQLAAADGVANNMAKLLCGRLRKVGSTMALAELKRELSDFNMHTGRWKPLGKSAK